MENFDIDYYRKDFGYLIKTNRDYYHKQLFPSGSLAVNVETSSILMPGKMEFLNV